MFNFGQLQIDHSYSIFPSHLLLSEVVRKTNPSHSAIIVDESHYVLTPYEREQMDSKNDTLTAKKWLKEKKWLPSTVCPLSKLLTSRLDWRRPVVVLNDGKIAGVVTSDEWIKYLTKENERLASYFHTLAETVNDAVTAVDHEGKVICWNHVAEQTYGIKQENILGRKIGEHFQMESIMLHQILDEGRPVRGAYHQPAPDTHVLINASPILEGHSVIGGIATEHDITRIVRLNEELYSSLPNHVQQAHPFTSLIGIGLEIQQAIKIAEKTANADIPVLLVGESGTGKEMLAQAIHFNSPRSGKPFISMNCAALPAGLLEAELFGYQGGAFSGEEHSGKNGKLEQAAGGSLFIEEIDQMPFDVQVKFLQCMEHHTFYHIGGTDPIPIRARIIAAASPALETMVTKGHFHEDLYYHLNVVSIEIPPLRERTEDIPELVYQFMKEFTVKYKKPMPSIDSAAMTALMNFDWPGNIRQLRNVVERFILLNDGETVTHHQLPKALTANMPVNAKAPDKAEPVRSNTQEVVLKAKMTTEKESAAIEEALRKTYGNKSAAAKLLGISRGTLYNKMKEYNLNG